MRSADKQKAYRKMRRERGDPVHLSGYKTQERINYMNKIKSGPCSDCRLTFDICCMDFDHRDPLTKSYNVASMFAGQMKIDKIKNEIDKCDLVCSNCHRIRTKNRYEQTRRYKKSC